MGAYSLKKLGPGLLFAGAAIGVSHLVQSTKVGAEFGFGLLWALLLVNLFKYPFFQYGPRYALATGESLLEGYQKLGKGYLILYAVITFATMFTIQTAVTIVTAGLASHLFGVTADLSIWSIVITSICLVLLVAGRYSFLDKLMKVIVVVLTVSTIAAVVVAGFKNEYSFSFQQIIPEGTAGMAFLIAFMGWMPGPLDISIWHSLWSIEKKRSNEDLTVSNGLFDFNVGYLSAIFLGICFVSLGALVMHHSGVHFSPKATKFSSQLINLYTSSLGSKAALFVGIAAFTTMFSTTLTTLDASPRSMARASQLLFGRLIKHSYIFWMMLLVLGTLTILLFFKSEMAFLIKLATILSFLTAPFYAILNFKLITSAHTPSQWQPTLGLKIWSILGIIFLIGFSIWYLMSL